MKYHVHYIEAGDPEPYVDIFDHFDNLEEVSEFLKICYPEWEEECIENNQTLEPISNLDVQILEEKMRNNENIPIKIFNIGQRNHSNFCLRILLINVIKIY